MKLTLAVLLTTAAVIAYGAETVTSPGRSHDSSRLLQPKVPAAKDLIGIWSQNGAGYQEGKPVTWKDQTLVIEAAEGQGFVGFKEYENEGEGPQKEFLNGAIGVDGDIRIADEDGFFVGRLVDGKILGQYVEVVKGESQVLNVELVRK